MVEPWDLMLLCFGDSVVSTQLIPTVQFCSVPQGCEVVEHTFEFLVLLLSNCGVVSAGRGVCFHDNVRYSIFYDHDLHTGTVAGFIDMLLNDERNTIIYYNYIHL